jgi:hypothetical protein
LPSEVLVRRTPSAMEATMIRFRASVAQTSLGWAVLLALVLAMRLAIPCGYMPVWTGGQLAIEPCDGTGPIHTPVSGTMVHHQDHHGKDKAAHRSICPFAAAAAQALPHSGIALAEVVLLLGAALLLGRAFCFIGRHRIHERPPLRGPPALALN